MLDKSFNFLNVVSQRFFKDLYKGLTAEILQIHNNFMAVDPLQPAIGYQTLYFKITEIFIYL